MGIMLRTKTKEFRSNEETFIYIKALLV